MACARVAADYYYRHIQMKLISGTRLVPAGFRSGGLVVVALAIAGCGRSDEVRVQRVPKVESAPAAAAALPADHPAIGGQMDFHAQAAGAAAQSPLKWKLPGGWQEKPLTQMRVGSFNVPGKEGQAADVS